MGVRVDITLYAPDDFTADTAARAAYSRYAELEQITSDYRPSSELMQLCSRAGTGPVEVSEELFLVISRAQEISALTDGAFDITASPVIRAWREARREDRIPNANKLKVLSGLVDWKMIKLDRRRQTVRLIKRGMLLDLGGIAKGYANDEALKTMKANGVDRAMIQAGGDISVSGPPPNKQGWSVKVRGLPDTIFLKHAAVSTSGDTEQFIEIEGVRYSHIVDPRTGYGSTTRILATIVSPSGILSDPLATSATIVEPAQTRALARRLGVNVILAVVSE